MRIPWRSGFTRIRIRKRSDMRNKKTIKTVLFQDWGTFFGTTMVCVSFKGYKDIVSHLKKVKYHDWHDAMKEKISYMEEGLDNNNHFSRWEHKGIKYTLLYLKDWKQDLEHYNTLAHELVHAVQFCMKDFLNQDREYEAVAYQHSYLFKNIAKELNKTYK
jgi:hypothetical protein